MVRTYEIFAPDDYTNEKINIIRNDYNWQGKWIYAIKHDDQIAIVQSEDMCPEKRENIEESAKAHIEMLKREEQQALEDEEKEKKEEEEKEQRMRNLEELTQKQTETLNSLTQLLLQMQLNQSNS